MWSLRCCPLGGRSLQQLLVKSMTKGGQTLGKAAGEKVEPKVVPVFFATNRKADETQPPETRFSGDPASTITLGLAHVTIPVAKHKIGTVETPAWWNLFADEKDASRYVVLHGVERLENTKFCTELGKAVTDGGQGSVLIFLHGYHVTFEEAAARGPVLPRHAIQGSRGSLQLAFSRDYPRLFCGRR